mmetsp:Transcript_20839/g.59446  ORF Transcript_20839/g.59446 Transcript_20839/m.59446 type:complete len:119 (-) Transcript_20839:58-414(-)
MQISRCQQPHLDQISFTATFPPSAGRHRDSRSSVGAQQQSSLGAPTSNADGNGKLLAVVGDDGSGKNIEVTDIVGGEHHLATVPSTNNCWATGRFADRIVAMKDGAIAERCTIQSDKQ